MNTKVRMAEKQDIPALCEIWKSCFSDSEEYINYFYRENFEHIEVLVFAIDGKPVSIAHLLDASFADRNHCQPAKFIYATGTLPAYRNRGYMGELIKFAKSIAKKNGYALFLKPASHALIAFYQSHGFEVDSCFRLVTLSPSKKQPLTVDDLTFTEYNRLRNAAFSDIPYVKWDNAHIHWCIEENKYFSGKTLKVKLDGKDYFLLGYPEENTLIINETNLSLNQLRLLSGALCDIFKTERINAYLLNSSCGEGEQIVSSVVYNAPVRNRYVNLILM